MITINYSGNIQILIDAAKKANELLQNDKFYNLINQKTNFDFTAASGIEISASIKKCNTNLNVISFKKILTRELGYEDLNDPTSIHINVAGNKLNRSIGSIVGTYIHESVHAADADDATLSYPHDGNLATGNENTAPYWIGNLAIQMIDYPNAVIDINNLAVVPHAPDDMS